MDTEQFATDFERLFRLTFARAARRVRDKRDLVSPESLALLEHLASAGPLTLTELSHHVDRAVSTLSETVDILLRKGWLERDRDPADGRRFLIWLSPLGQAIRTREHQVLDSERLRVAGAHLTETERAMLVSALERLVESLTNKESRDGR